MICRPLHDALKKGQFMWNDEQENAFMALKKALITAPVLALPDFEQPFILETDASGTGIGAVMLQQGRAIAYYSKALCPTNAALSTYEKEALAIIEALKRWRHYFLGNKLIIKTDQQSLKFITDQKLTEGIQHKLMMKLLEFDFTIQYKRGVLNRVADALSRQFSLNSMSQVTPVWAQDLLQSYIHDTTLKPIMEKLLLQNNEEHQDYTLSSGILRYQGKIVVGHDNQLRQKLLNALHSSPVGGHSGMRATYHRIKGIFYWPGLKKDTETFVAHYPICQRSKHEQCLSPGLLEPPPVPDMAWAHVSMDFIEGLPKSQGMEVISLLLMDELVE
ncbi:hypothetical protein ACQJBY_049956 [Aegilops geniculata]